MHRGTVGENRGELTRSQLSMIFFGTTAGNFQEEAFEPLLKRR
eukprot:CAMPEP_0172210556 /NCGR_PEP_ID=MMETSP1050-20130122/35828_1 /TAXON_ID=233186 /ORGANISM="Cryptomonas curvata, Strain CCAP979/52" /LENGTH=42 /DNA_ID= /DNA_START= /DNA_END= /DNA_ORIENTATION=